MAFWNEENCGRIEEAPIFVQPSVMDAGGVGKNVPFDANGDLGFKVADDPATLVLLHECPSVCARAPDAARIIADEVAPACPSGHLENDEVCCGGDFQREVKKVSPRVRCD